MNPTITVAVALSIDIVVAKDWGNGADVEFTVKRRLELVFYCKLSLLQIHYLNYSNKN